MAKKLRSMDVTIRGVTKTYEFDPAATVNSDDEGEASLELLGEAETTEVELVSGDIVTATVEVTFEYRYTSTIEVDVEDIEGCSTYQEVVDEVESGNFYAVTDAIGSEVSDNVDDMHVTIHNVEVRGACDEDGEEVEDLF